MSSSHLQLTVSFIDGDATNDRYPYLIHIGIVKIFKLCALLKIHLTLPPRSHTIPDIGYQKKRFEHDSPTRLFVQRPFSEKLILIGIMLFTIYRPPCALRNHLARSFATDAPKTIASVVSTASESSPLKDAVKFINPDAKSVVWTYRELSRHVDALASGFRHLSYSPGDKIVTALPPYAPEYAVLLLAAARLGLTLVPVPTPTANNSFDVASLEQALSHHHPKALIISHELSVAAADQSASDDRAISTTNPVLSALDPSLAIRDSAGLSGFAPLTGRSAYSSRFPSIRHFVHTGDKNTRAAISFRSLFVYDGPPSVKEGLASLPYLAGNQVSSGVVTQADLLKSAQETSKKLSLNPDHSQKNGKVVIRPEHSKEAASTVIAALMRQALWLSPHPRNVEQTAKDEDAILA